MTQIIKGNIVDIAARSISFGEIHIENGKITRLVKGENEEAGAPFIIPGFIDSHVHVESSMLVPSEFARMAVVHGTVGTISDPHEIANVCGIEGVKFMIENGKTVPFKFHFGAPSCVPATIFETAGASVDKDEVDELLSMKEIFYLSEMMNFPGVLNNDPEVLAKIDSAKKYNKPVDGHAPGLRGEAAKKYIAAGISTDHECFTLEEASEKLQLGMKILIREGSAAKNFEALAPLLNDHWENMMFCSDDKHPDSLEEGHINVICARAVAMGIDAYKVLQAACINPVHHYRMNIGLLQTGDPADLCVVENLKNFRVLETYIDGSRVAANGKTMIESAEVVAINYFDCREKQPADFIIPFKGEKSIHVIEALDGQLITNKIKVTPNVIDGNIVANTDNDILKIAVVNRYHEAPVALAFIKNTGIKAGAIASSVAHDSHNIVVAGTDDESICEAVNLIIREKGGISAAGKGKHHIIPLPVAGLMSADEGYDVSKRYTEIDRFVKGELGSTLHSPFMTLSFMALLVIPSIKLSDKGLFDGERFCFMENEY